MVVLNHYLLLATFLFCVGAIGVMVRRNAIVLLMSVELMLNAGNLAVIAFARFAGARSDYIAGNGMALVFVVMTVAAAEVAIGLAILINLHRQRESIDADQVHDMAG